MFFISIVDNKDLHQYVFEDIPTYRLRRLIFECILNMQCIPCLREISLKNISTKILKKHIHPSKVLTSSFLSAELFILDFSFIVRFIVSINNYFQNCHKFLCHGSIFNSIFNHRRIYIIQDNMNYILTIIRTNFFSCSGRTG